MCILSVADLKEHTKEDGEVSDPNALEDVRAPKLRTSEGILIGEPDECIVRDDSEVCNQKTNNSDLSGDNSTAEDSQEEVFLTDDIPRTNIDDYVLDDEEEEGPSGEVHKGSSLEGSTSTVTEEKLTLEQESEDLDKLEKTDMEDTEHRTPEVMKEEEGSREQESGQPLDITFKEAGRADENAKESDDVSAAEEKCSDVVQESCGDDPPTLPSDTENDTNDIQEIGANELAVEDQLADTITDEHISNEQEMQENAQDVIKCDGVEQGEQSEDTIEKEVTQLCDNGKDDQRPSDSAENGDVSVKEMDSDPDHVARCAVEEQGSSVTEQKDVSDEGPTGIKLDTNIFPEEVDLTEVAKEEVLENQDSVHGDNLQEVENPETRATDVVVCDAAAACCTEDVEDVPQDVKDPDFSCDDCTDEDVLDNKAEGAVAHTEATSAQPAQTGTTKPMPEAGKGKKKKRRGKKKKGKAKGVPEPEFEVSHL